LKRKLVLNQTLGVFAKYNTFNLQLLLIQCHIVRVSKTKTQKNSKTLKTCIHPSQMKEKLKFSKEMIIVPHKLTFE